MKINISQISNEKDPEDSKDFSISKKNEKKIKHIKTLDIEKKEPESIKIKFNGPEEQKNKSSLKIDIRNSTEEKSKEVIINKKLESEIKPETKISIEEVEAEKNNTDSFEKEILIIGKDSPAKEKPITNIKKEGSILIAEDEKPLSRALEIKLTKEGYDVCVASNGEDAMNYLDKNKFDLVILDLVMPKKDGFAVLEHLKENKKKLNIIVLSNLAQEEDFKKAKDLGALTYFIKSNTPIVELIRYIRENI
jgi:CheY-like chemotaxis protein